MRELHLHAAVKAAANDPFSVSSGDARPDSRYGLQPDKSGCVASLSGAGDGNRRHQAEVKTGLPEDVGQRPMVIACRLEGDLARKVECTERRHEAVDLGLCVRDAQRASLAARQFQQYLEGHLRNVDRYPNG